MKLPLLLCGGISCSFLDFYNWNGITDLESHLISSKEYMKRRRGRAFYTKLPFSPLKFIANPNRGRVANVRLPSFLIFLLFIYLLLKIKWFKFHCKIKQIHIENQASTCTCWWKKILTHYTTCCKLNMW